MTRPEPDVTPARPDAEVAVLGDQDLHLFNEGTHRRLYRVLGAHPLPAGGTRFAVWAPNAESVGVIGDFNGWQGAGEVLRPRGSSGIWEGSVASARPGARYKYRIRGRGGAAVPDKADPLAFAAELPPRTASVVWDLSYDWGDGEWMRDRARNNGREAPLAIYELHLGSWRRRDGGHLGYRELAPLVAAYVNDMGFTHVELMPVMEHPFYGSWGYQCTGYFAPTRRYGTPQDFMYLIDTLHRSGVGVILDWVPSHFPGDDHGLRRFDGTSLYEHDDPRLGHHPDWDSYIFNYGRNEVRGFLLSSAFMWLDRYHADGLRVDAVASMLYRDYSRAEGEWIPNRHGGRENLEAVDCLRAFNAAVYADYPDVQTIAEESTAWPGVSRPTHFGGLGFGFKWDMGWMHDTLLYMEKDPVHRPHHHDTLTFRMIYAFTESYVLPLSHDEVVYGKGALAAKMPGDEWQKLANLRLLFGYMYGQPAKKLLFMGGEMGTWREWSHEEELDWGLLESPAHAGIARWVRDLNRLYRSAPALHRCDAEPEGFEWIEGHDAANSVIAFLRRSPGERPYLVVCNFTPVVRHRYRVGVPAGGPWREVLNGDAEEYGGSGQGNLGAVAAEAVEWHGRDHSLELTLPPLACLFLTPDEG